MTNRELTFALLERFGLTGDDAEARIRHVADRPGHDLRYSVDTAKIRALGWAPRHTFEEALDATIAWYRGQRLVVAAAEGGGCDRAPRAGRLLARPVARARPRHRRDRSAGL